MPFDIVRIPLALGRGLDRANGLASVEPQFPVDCRNVYARDGKLTVRPGFTRTMYEGLLWGTDVLAIVPIKATGDELFCLYDRTSREIRIYRLNVATQEMQALPSNGVWGTLGAITPFPVVTAAEANGLVFFAHDENAMLFRLPTIYYSPDFADPDLPGTLTTLTADLDGDGVEADVYFRGVYSYLEYMVGWGFGNEGEDEDDRGDVLRLSVPGEPTRFEPGNYALFGAQKDPIRAVIAADDVLAVGKENESYKLIGSSGIDFGVMLLDARFGVVSSRCAVNIGGVAYWWSSDGARRVTAAGTFPIAQALELISPLPDDFPVLGPSRFCFAFFDRARKTLEWLFPRIETVAVRTPGFVLSLWNPADPRWTFSIREQCICCAGELLLSDEADVPAPTGYASTVEGVDTGISADPNLRNVSVSWVNNGEAGDEIVQIFAKPTGGDWSVVLSVPVGDTVQAANLNTLLPLTEYTVALRYMRGTRAAEGYEGNDPDAWDAATAPGAMDTFETSSAAVAWTGGAFTGASNPITLSWASAQVGVPYLLEKDPGTGFETVAADLVANSYVYAIPPGELGTTVIFRVTAQRGLIVGPVAAPDLEIDMFFDPSSPAWVSAVWNAATGFAALQWTAGAGTTSTRIEKSPDGVTWTPVATIAGTTYNYAPSAAEINTLVHFRLFGLNTGFESPASPTQDVTFTVNLVAQTIGAAMDAIIPSSGPITQMQVQVTGNPPPADDRQFIGVYLAKTTGSGQFGFTLVATFNKNIAFGQFLQFTFNPPFGALTAGIYLGKIAGLYNGAPGPYSNNAQQGS